MKCELKIGTVTNKPYLVFDNEDEANKAWELLRSINVPASFVCFDGYMNALDLDNRQTD